MVILLKIKINGCANPKKCMKCIKICPAKILVLKPLGTKSLSDYVEEWKIVTIFKELCNGCMKCAEICPNKYIKIEFK